MLKHYLVKTVVRTRHVVSYAPRNVVTLCKTRGKQALWWGLLCLLTKDFILPRFCVHLQGQAEFSLWKHLAAKEPKECVCLEQKDQHVLVLFYCFLLPGEVPSCLQTPVRLSTHCSKWASAIETWLAALSFSGGFRSYMHAYCFNGVCVQDGDVLKFKTQRGWTSVGLVMDTRLSKEGTTLPEICNWSVKTQHCWRPTIVRKRWPSACQSFRGKLEPDNLCDNSHCLCDLSCTNAC